MAKPKRKSNKVHKTERHVVPANFIKFEQVKAMLEPFQTALADQLVEVDKDFMKGQDLSNLPKWKPADFQSPLSARQFQMSYTQMIENYSSYLALLQDKFRKVVSKSNLSTEAKIYLYQINKFKSWYKNQLTLTWIEKDGKIIPANPKKVKDTFQQDVPTQYFTLARKILKRCRKWISRPNLLNCPTMKLDTRVAAREEAKTSKHFRYWMKVSTLRKGKPVYLPLKNNPYFEKLAQSETVTNTVQITFYKDHLTISPILESDPVTMRTEGRAVGMDFGMTHLFTTSDGQLLGSKMLQRLRIWDQLLMEHDAALQAAGKSRKKDATHLQLNDKIRTYVKNEVGRLLNQLSKQDIQTLVVEDLEFSGSGLSKRLNRLLTRVGRAAIKAKYARLTELDGIKVVKVEPAYTSQQCSSCDYVSKNNRKSQKRFICECCGLSINADVNAAKNIRARRSRPKFRVYSSQRRQKFLNKLHEKHRLTCVSGNHREGNSGPCLATVSL